LYYTSYRFRVCLCLIHILLKICLIIIPNIIIIKLLPNKQEACHKSGGFYLDRILPCYDVRLCVCKLADWLGTWHQVAVPGRARPGVLFLPDHYTMWQQCCAHCTTHCSTTQLVSGVHSSIHGLLMISLRMSNMKVDVTLVLFSDLAAVFMICAQLMFCTHMYIKNSNQLHLCANKLLSR